MGNQTTFVMKSKVNNIKLILTCTCVYMVINLPIHVYATNIHIFMAQKHILLVETLLGVQANGKVLSKFSRKRFILEFFN